MAKKGKEKKHKRHNDNDLDKVIIQLIQAVQEPNIIPADNPGSEYLDDDDSLYATMLQEVCTYIDDANVKSNAENWVVLEHINTSLSDVIMGTRHRLHSISPVSMDEERQIFAAVQYINPDVADDAALQAVLTNTSLFIVCARISHAYALYAQHRIKQKGAVIDASL